jgi:hypothetical protein
MEIVALVVVLAVVVALMGWRLWRFVQGGRQAVGTMRDLADEFERQRHLHESGQVPGGQAGETHGRGVNPRESARQEEP